MRSKKLLIISATWPQPKATAAGIRMMQLLQCFIDQGHILTFASTSPVSEISSDLSQLDIKQQHIQLNHHSFDDFILELNPEIVLFDRFMIEEQFGWRVTQHIPNALRILDTEDLHSLRTARKLAFETGLEFSTDYWLNKEVTKREIASIYRCDLSLIISDYEMKLLQNTLNLGDELLLYLPFMLEKIKANILRKGQSFEDRQHFISIGNGKHAPNIDAILWLKQEIWPLIRKAIPDSLLHIYGAYLPDKINHLHCPDEGFYIQGWVQDSREVMRKARINLAPLRFGAGLKGKLIEAMVCGTPSITTTIGAEGMHGDYPWGGGIGNDPEEFAKLAVKLYNDKLAWKKAQKEGIMLVNKCYGKNRHKKRLLSKIDIIQENLQKHRTKNFIGSMLLHHTISSTKYMAKWIAAKSN